MKNKPLVSIVLSIFLAALTFSGCRTMEGAGNDIEAAGDRIEDAADDAAN